MSTLTRSERHSLAELEEVIAKGLQTFHVVGKALLEIRDKRLYKEQYSTWEDYCRERWEIGRAHAYRLINAADVVADLSPIGDTGPRNEAQARALVPLPPEQRRQVWEHATANGSTTSRQLQELASDALAGLSPERQREVIEESERKIIREVTKARDAASREEQLGQVVRLAERIDRILEGLGTDSRTARRHLDRLLVALADL